MSRPLHVLYALQGFPPNQRGGTEWETWRRARYLLRHNQRVSVVAIDQLDPSLPQPVCRSIERVDGIPVHRLSLQGGQAWGDRSEFDDSRVYEALRHILVSERPDLVHVMSGYRMTVAAINAAADLKIPVLLTAMDFWLICPRVTLRRDTGSLCVPPDDTATCVACLCGDWRRYRLPSRLTRGRSAEWLAAAWRHPQSRSAKVKRIFSAVGSRPDIIRHAVSRTHGVIVASRFLADMLAGRVVDYGRLTLMRQGLDASDWLPAQPQRRETINIGFIGQPAEHKGLFDLISAYRRLAGSRQQLQLLIFGDHASAWPPVRERLYQQVSEQESIHLMGPFANNEIRTVHAQIDLLVVPSKWYENSPNVILEAFACGTPVVVSRLGGMAELLKDGIGGWTFEAGNVQDLADVLAAAIDHPDRLAQASHNLPQPQSITEEMAELMTMYEAAAAHHSVSIPPQQEQFTP